MTFTDWKQSNKHIVFSLYDLADEMRGRGHKHWSIRGRLPCHQVAHRYE